MLERAAIMLDVIAEEDAANHVGFKAARGVRTAEKAVAYYLLLADKIIGKEWTIPRSFRLGASSLLGSLLTVLEQKACLPKRKL